MASSNTKVTSRKKRRVVKEAAAEVAPLYDYELVLVINPEVSEEGLEATLNNISQFINDNGGTISHVEQWGKRKLAYPIEHFMEGNYVLTRFQMRPTLNKELGVKLQISEEVLRHLLIRLSS